MRPMLKPIAAALLLALAGASGCASAPVTHRHELRVAFAIDPASLSPLVAFQQDEIALDQLWCQTLVGLDERNRIVPILVTRIPSRENGDVSGDGTRITYHLRRDVRFADGVPFTSADVAFTFRALFDPANETSGIDAYQRVTGLTTPDAHTVVVRLRKPWSAAVNVLFAQADFAYGILPKHAFASTKISGTQWEQKAFGTGPFRVVAWHRGESLELEPNPEYRPKPKLRRILLRIIPDQTAALNALHTHEVDVAELNPDTVAAAAGIAGVRIDRLPQNGLRALYFQTTAEPTNDVHVRRAIAYALDPRALSKAWLGAFPRAMSIFPTPLRTWGAAPPPYPYDPAAAARELDAAGWHLRGRNRVKAGKQLEFVGAYDASKPELGRVTVVVQNQLAQLGVGVTVKAYANNLYSSPAGPLRTGRFSFTTGGLIGGSDPEQSINLLCSQARDGGDNYARFCSPALETYFTRQMAARSEAERHRDFDAIAKIARDEVPLLPLFEILYVQGVDTRVTGYTRNMLRYPVRAEAWDAL